MSDTIKLTHAALDEDTSHNIVLRGVLAPESFKLLKVAAYHNPPALQLGMQLEDITYTDDNADYRHFIKAKFQMPKPR